MRIVMNVTPVFQIEIEPCCAASILRPVDAWVYICSCSVISWEYLCKKKYAFVYDSHFKPLHQSKFCGSILYNISHAPICVL